MQKDDRLSLGIAQLHVVKPRTSGKRDQHNRTQFTASGAQTLGYNDAQWEPANP
jgi:hypothetical protein